MKTTDLKDLLKTVELLRKELHPELDAAFLKAVVHAEEQNPEDDGEALREIEAALKKVLAKQGAD